MNWRLCNRIRVLVSPNYVHRFFSFICFLCKMLFARAAKTNWKWEAVELPTSSKLPQAVIDCFVSLSGAGRGVPFFQLRWQKSMYFSWEHKSLYHLPPKKKLYLFGHLLKLHSHEIRPNTDFIYFFISQWESSLHFALLERVFVFSPFISHSLCLLFLMRIWKKKRAFLISVDNITRAIFNSGFCK